MVDKKALEKRDKIKRNKPNFVVKESKFSARVKSRWRFPNGKHSKVRQMHKGRPVLPSLGFGSPRSVRGLHPSGLEVVMIFNVQDLATVDPSKQGAMISTRVGKRKKLDILKSAAEKRITLLNVKDAVKLVEKIETMIVDKKKAKEKRSLNKHQKEAEKKKKAEEKEKSDKTEKTSDLEKEVSTELKEEKIKNEQQKQKEIAEKVITKKQ